ncbi:unnamed protein product, partial [Ectocarpus fasciculatus]
DSRPSSDVELHSAAAELRWLHQPPVQQPRWPWAGGRSGLLDGTRVRRAPLHRRLLPGHQRARALALASVEPLLVLLVLLPLLGVLRNRGLQAGHRLLQLLRAEPQQGVHGGAAGELGGVWSGGVSAAGAEAPADRRRRRRRAGPDRALVPRGGHVDGGLELQPRDHAKKRRIAPARYTRSVPLPPTPQLLRVVLVEPRHPGGGGGGG